MTSYICTRSDLMCVWISWVTSPCGPAVLSDGGHWWRRYRACCSMALPWRPRCPVSSHRIQAAMATKSLMYDWSGKVWQHDVTTGESETLLPARKGRHSLGQGETLPLKAILIKSNNSPRSRISRVKNVTSWRQTLINCLNKGNDKSVLNVLKFGTFN